MKRFAIFLIALFPWLIYGIYSIISICSDCKILPETFYGYYFKFLQLLRPIIFFCIDYWILIKFTYSAFILSVVVIFVYRKFNKKTIRKVI